jgi:hypothetical protein
VLLAHHHLVNRRFAECLQFCQRAVNMDPSTGLESELLEWIGIAQAGLGFAAELVRGSFEKAIRLDPSNERAKRNLMIFEAANEPLGVQYWETRTASALRTSSLAERPLPLAA